MSDDSNVTFHYYSGIKWEWLIVAVSIAATLSFFIGRMSVPPSAEAIAHKQEMERLRSEESARQAEVVAEALALQTALVTESLEVAMAVEEANR